MDIKELRKISLEFRRVSSDALYTTYEVGNLHLIRLRKYIEENQNLMKIIEDIIVGIEVDYNSEFIITDNYWIEYNVPVDKAKHIKAMWDYLKELTQDEKDLTGIGIRFQCDSTKYTDRIRSFISKIFKPLIDFLVDSLSMEIMLLEDELKDKINISQYIGQNYGTANVANRDITSTNYVNINEIQEVNKLISEIIDELNKINQSSEEIEEFKDDIEIIKENVNDKNPNITKLKKAYKSIINFIKDIPAKIVVTDTIINNSKKLIDYIKGIIETIV